VTDPTKSRRAVALRIAQAIQDHWIEQRCDYDVDEATDLIEQLIPMSAAEAEAEMEAMRDDDEAAPVDPVVNPTLQAFKNALGVEKMSIIDCIKMATERLASLRIVDVTASEWVEYWSEGNEEQWRKDYPFSTSGPVVSTAEMCEAAKVMGGLLSENEKLRAQLAAVRAKLEQIVCVKEPDAGVIWLSSESPTHREIREINGKKREVMVCDHQYFSPLGDALIELYQLTKGES